MNSRSSILQRIIQDKIVAIIRLKSSEPISQLAEALVEGGVRSIEVTMGTPNALEEISKLAAHPHILPGAGSVTDAETTQKVIEAGAEFIVTPISKREIIETAHQYGKPVLSGALTPTEVLQAYEWGADIVKLFPASTFGLPYFKAIKAPIPHIPIMPTGGVSVENAAEWIQNGALCLGVGSSLIHKQYIIDEDFEAITQLAKAFCEAVDIRA